MASEACPDGQYWDRGIRRNGMGAPVVCPSCGTTDRFFEIDKLSEYTVVQCTVCSLQFSRPMKSPGGTWYDKAYVIRHSAIDTRIREYYTWALRVLPKQGKLLDIGCGEGVFVDYARRNGLDAFGVDFSKEAVELGRKWYGLTTIFNSSLAELREVHHLVDFDIITMFEVIEHLENPAEFLHEIMTLLKPDGIIVVSVPNEDRWPYRDFGDFPPNHLTRWNERSLRTFFLNNGYENLQIRVSSRLRSYHNFLGYLVRRAVYGIFGMHAKGFDVTGSNAGEHIFSKTFFKKIVSRLRPRQVRDMLFWPLALATFPIVFRWFRGSNLLLVASKGKHSIVPATTADCMHRSLHIDRSLNYGRHHIEHFLSAAGAYRNVLDIGAGLGTDLLIARACNPQAALHAIEVSDEYARLLADKTIAVHALNIERDWLPFEDGTIDVVIANQILEHIKELFWVLHEVSRVLPVGGKFIIGVPNLAALHNRILLAIGRQPSPLKNNSAHVRGFTKHDLLMLFESCFPGGYHLQQYGGSNFYPFPPVLARPLAALLPNMAWGIFFLFEKKREYRDEFLRYPVQEGLETNFYIGRQ